MHGPLREVCRGQTLEVRVAWSGDGHHSPLQYAVWSTPKFIDLNAEIVILQILDRQIEIRISIRISEENDQ